MKAFDYSRATDMSQAIGVNAGRLIAGGTNLLDLMKLEIETPERLTDINPIGLDEIEEKDGGLSIGALVTNSVCAADPRVRKHWPLLSRAILAGASPQLRNQATTGGNLCQRTRCGYFYDLSSACNKREPGSGCDALRGVNRNHAILGTSESCIATYPGDMAVALAALDATVLVEGPDGQRNIPLRKFHRLPEDTPWKDNVLRPSEVITSVTLPPPLGGRQVYRKVRDRSSYAFALVSVAAVVVVESGRISTARIALGSVAHKPWHDTAVDAMLAGHTPSPKLFADAADQMLADAQGHGGNDFKIELARRTLCAVLTEATKV
ncbi:FAD binding domain-containing protein [Seohaeicola nanhaiensis]|uniref:FAD binding domain-containing protein n=1 Tax=Seohaeicola nanhaiensis TaxID=1387282 RepID=A0ABV9KH64_9RHOB